MRIASILAALIAVFVLVGCWGSGNSGGGAFTHIFVADGGNGRIVQINDIAGLGWATLGTVGSGTNQFDDPTGIAFDSVGGVYICDFFNNRIVRFDSITGSGWIAFGTAGSGVGQFSNPYKISIDALDRIYITDSGNDRVVRIDDMFGTNWTTFGSSGSGTNQFSTPIGIAVAQNFQIYVTDFGNNRVVRFDDMGGSSWTTLGTAGSGVGQFNSAVDIDLDTSGHMLVTDRSGRVIQTNQMSTTGWTSFSISTPQSSTYAGGKIYIVDQNVDKLTRIDSIGGANLVTFGSTGSGTNQFSSPVAVRAH